MLLILEGFCNKVCSIVYLFNTSCSAFNAKYFRWQGLVPAGIRLVPHTVLTFIFLEQLKKYFGICIIS